VTHDEALVVGGDGTHAALGVDRPWLVGCHLAVVASAASELNESVRTTLRVFFDGPDGQILRYERAHSPWGLCVLGYGERGLASLTFETRDAAVSHSADAWHPIFCGTLQKLTIQCHGSAFEHAVWRALLEIPRGTVTSYAAIAKTIGRPGASRAVGRAVGRNALAWVVPCHRVLPLRGGLGGFRWGSALKSRFLAAEGSLLTDTENA
jgi:O-6-methylguanine DNA methyltransferase